MRTPAGTECRFFYQDFNRGRGVQECRLVQGNRESLPWRPHYCAICPVPDILSANASPDLSLKLTIKPRLLGLGRQMEVTATCLKHHIPVDDPHVGCPKCNAERPGFDVFLKSLESDEE